jgi:hypothetical protein
MALMDETETRVLKVARDPMELMVTMATMASR